MLPSPKATALAVGMLTALSVATLAQSPAPSARPPVRSTGETIVVTGQIDWLEKSNVSAIREGVIDQVEFQVGDKVEKGAIIGYLKRKSAELAVKKAEIAATSTGAIKKAEASSQLAKVQLAIQQNLRKKNAMNVSFEEMQKAEAELLAATAAVQEATENQNLAKAEMAIAQQILEEHTITAPFTGYVTDRFKSPGEAVRASEPVILLVRTDRLRFFGFIPLESAARVKIGDTVEVQPRIDNADLPIEKQKFIGKVSALTREIPTIGRTEMQVLAEIENSDSATGIGTELLKGMQAEMTIFLNTTAPNAGAAPKVATSAR